MTDRLAEFEKETRGRTQSVEDRECSARERISNLFYGSTTPEHGTCDTGKSKAIACRPELKAPPPRQPEAWERTTIPAVSP
jgi:hypothetical protein